MVRRLLQALLVAAVCLAVPTSSALAHPWMPNDAMFPLNATYVTGSWQNSNGSSTVVYCLVMVMSENPNWYENNFRYTHYAGGARCNLQIQGMSGNAWAINYGSPVNPDQTTVLDGPRAANAQHADPEGNGWQSYAHGYFNRGSDSTTQQIKTVMTLEMPVRAASGWNSLGQGCTRGSNNRLVTCELWSPPYQAVPYPCPSPMTGSIGAIRPYCVDAPPQCPSGQVGIGTTCVQSGPCPAGQVGYQPACLPLPNPQPVVDEAEGQVAQQAPTPPENVIAASMTGRAVRGETLVAHDGVWRGAQPITYSYQWGRCNEFGGSCSDIPGQTAKTYVPQVEDVDRTVRVRVTAANAGSSSSMSAPSAVVGMNSDPNCDRSDQVTQVPTCWRRGVNAVAFNPQSFTDKEGGRFGESRLSLRKLRSFGGHTVVLPVQVFANGTTGEVTRQTTNPNAAGTLTDGDLRTAACLVNRVPKDRNLILKLHLGGVEHTSFNPTGDALTRFRSTYRDVALRYTRMALELRADGFVIGNELTELTTSNDDTYWRNLIRGKRDDNGGKTPIRGQRAGLWDCSQKRVLRDKMLSGGSLKLYFGANHDSLANFESTSFWSLLDYIGFSAYFPLSLSNPSPSSAEIRDGWRYGRDLVPDAPGETDRTKLSPLTQLDRVNRLFPNQAIVFTELGYIGKNYAAVRPWEENLGETDNELLRQRLYQEAFRYWSERNPRWLKGMWPWLWPVRPSEYGGKDRGFNLRPNRDTTNILCRWFKTTETNCGDDFQQYRFAVAAPTCDELEAQTGNEVIWDVCSEALDPDGEGLAGSLGAADTVNDPPNPDPESQVDPNDPLAQGDDPDGPTADDVVDEPADD